MACTGARSIVIPTGQGVVTAGAEATPLKRKNIVAIDRVGARSTDPTGQNIVTAGAEVTPLSSIPSGINIPIVIHAGQGLVTAGAEGHP